MKNQLWIAFIIVFQLSIIGQTQWQWQNPLPQGNYLTDICFVDTLNGYSCGYLGTILKTTNGGKNWDKMRTNTDTLLSRLSFPNLQNGWAMGYYNSSIYRTTDAGENWVPLDTITNSSMNDLEMVDDSIGYACGPDSKIFKTTNGGVTWTSSETPFYISSLNSIDFVSDSIGYCVGKSLYLLKTTNGGESWKYLSMPISSSNFNINFVHFKTEYFGYVAGYADNKGLILITTDGGNSWTGWVSENPIIKAYFENPSIGWIVETNGNVLYTTDGAKNWTELLQKCSNLFFLNEKYSWAISNRNNILYSKTGWHNYVTQTKSASHEKLNDIAIGDSSNIFVCGNKEILGTKDGGKSWNVLLVDSSAEFSAIKLKNNNEIWTVSGGNITYSLDDGKSWSEIKLDTYLDDIFFLNSSTGYAVGGNLTAGRIFETTDGGNTWSSLDSLNGHSSTNYINNIVFANDSIGWMTTTGGIFKIEEGGNNWKNVKSGDYTALAAFNNSVWASYDNQIVFSNNSGSTWNDVVVYKFNNGYAPIMSIDFINENFGVISTADGRVFRTTDGGFNWDEGKRISGSSINRIKYINENEGWAVGDNGSILYYGNLTTDIKNNLLIATPNYFKLFQNYPNPFNPTTTISYELPKGSNVQIIIYNILGKKIKELVSSYQNPGKHSVIWNANDFASGIYFYTIRAGKYIDTKKLVLLK